MQAVAQISRISVQRPGRSSAFSKGNDTAGAAKGRLQSYFDQGQQPSDMAIVALGTNDAVQGLATSTTKADLREIIDLFSDADPAIF